MSDAVDVLLYIALSEEFEALKKELGDGFLPQELSDVALTVYLGKIHSSVLGRDFSVAVAPAGKMGNTRSATAVSVLIEKFKPADVIVLGIAGSLSNDMEPGDVFVPESVNEYLANSATTGNGDRWEFQTSGDQFQTSVRLLNRLANFAHGKPEHFGRWQKSAEQRRKAILSAADEQGLEAAGLVMRGNGRLFAADSRKLASGPAVGKGTAFAEWIRREVDRKVAALEMESAGVYDAGIIRIPAPRTVAIRGISDYADERKAKVEEAAAGKFRELSARNAVSLLIHAIDAGLFEPDTGAVAGSPRSSGGAVLDSTVRSVFVIGGVTGETDDVDSEQPRLNQASLQLGEVLARAGVQLVVCSPFPDSADYYTAMGYAVAKQGGTIQFHSPTHEKVEDKRRRLRTTFGDSDVTLQDWNYPGPEQDEEGCWHQAWLLAQLQALEKADAVVALGGKISQSASTLLHLAEAKGLPIVPFSFLGGAARRAFDRRDWARLNPGFDTSVLTKPEGVGHAVEIASRLVLDRVKRMATAAEKPKTVFMSVARQDAEVADVLGAYLESQGVRALVGDHEIRSDQMIPASIEQALLGSDVCAIFWSRHYSQSPWCFDELSIAIEQQSYGNMNVWLFNLDDSAIVPKQARKLPMISVKSAKGLLSAATQLLA
jgi:nucleoside phosphorylase